MVSSISELLTRGKKRGNFSPLFEPCSFLSERVWRNGSASASQAEGCGFESRRPLQITFTSHLALREIALYVLGTTISCSPRCDSKSTHSGIRFAHQMYLVENLSGFIA